MPSCNQETFEFFEGKQFSTHQRTANCIRESTFYLNYYPQISPTTSTSYIPDIVVISDTNIDLRSTKIYTTVRAASIFRKRDKNICFAS